MTSKNQNRRKRPPTQEKLKKKVLNLRIDAQTLDIMTNFEEKTGGGKSELVRKAIHQYVLMNWHNEERPHPKLIFAWNMMKPLLDFADEKTLRDIVEISYANGRANQHKYTQYYQKFVGKADSVNDPSYLLEILTDWVFSPEAQNWCTEAKWYQQGPDYYFSARHQLGTHFSRFLVLLLARYLEESDYVIKKTEKKQVLTTIIDKSGERQIEEFVLTAQISFMG